MALSHILTKQIQQDIDRGHYVPIVRLLETLPYDLRGDVFPEISKHAVAIVRYIVDHANHVSDVQIALLELPFLIKLYVKPSLLTWDEVLEFLETPSNIKAEHLGEVIRNMVCFFPQYVAKGMAVLMQACYVSSRHYAVAKYTSILMNPEFKDLVVEYGIKNINSLNFTVLKDQLPVWNYLNDIIKKKQLTPKRLQEVLKEPKIYIHDINFCYKIHQDPKYQKIWNNHYNIRLPQTILDTSEHGVSNDYFLTMIRDIVIYLIYDAIDSGHIRTIFNQSTNMENTLTYLWNIQSADPLKLYNLTSQINADEPLTIAILDQICEVVVGLPNIVSDAVNRVIRDCETLEVLEEDVEHYINNVEKYIEKYLDEAFQNRSIPAEIALVFN